MALIVGIYCCREYGLQSSATSSDDADTCAVCLERTCTVGAEGTLFFCSFNLSLFSHHTYALLEQYYSIVDECCIPQA